MREMNRERYFSSSQGFLLIWSPLPRLILLMQHVERSLYGRQVGEKMGVNVQQAQEGF